MADGVLIVLAHPVAGRDEEFNDWYDHQHLADVLALPGFVAAQRYEYVASTRDDVEDPGYLAVYEIEGDLGEAMATLESARSDPSLLRSSDALDRERTFAHFYRPKTGRITRADTGS